MNPHHYLPHPGFYTHTHMPTGTATKRHVLLIFFLLARLQININVTLLPLLSLSTAPVGHGLSTILRFPCSVPYLTTHGTPPVQRSQPHNSNLAEVLKYLNRGLIFRSIKLTKFPRSDLNFRYEKSPSCKVKFLGCHH